jgi:Zn-dependent protease
VAAPDGIGEGAVRLPAGVGLRVFGLRIVFTRGVVGLMVGDLVGGFFFARLAANDARNDAIISLMIAFGTVAALTLHELGHALAARIRGLTVLGVAVRWFGAGTYIDRGYPDGSTAWRVAAAGPVASFLGMFASLALVVHVPPGPLRVGFFVLAFVNFFLCIGNAVPVEPLDGYRILLGILWIRLSEKRAEQVTRYVGSVLLAALAAGALYALVGDRRSLALLLAVVFVVFEAQRLVAGRHRPRTPHA